MAAEGFEGAVEGTVCGIEAALHEGEGLVVHGGDFALAVFDVVLVPQVVELVFPHAGFGDGEAAEQPFAGNDGVEDGGEFGSGGAVVVVVAR